MKRKLLLIVNPISGKSQIRNELFNVVDKFAKQNYEITIYITQHKNDAKTKLQTEQNNYDLIVCTGGDGTLNEVVSGIISAEKTTPIGYIPMGTTNDFANSVGLSRDISIATETVIREKPFKCDIGKFNEHYFTYVAAFGLFTSVAYSTPQQTKNMLGHAAYVLESVKGLADIKSYYIKAEFNGGIYEEQVLFGMVSNTTQVAGFKNLTSNTAELNDGLFEVLFIKMPSNLTEFKDIIVELLTQSTNTKYIHRFSTDKIKITTKDIMEWTLDGEGTGVLSEVNIENLKQSITLYI